MPTLALLVQPHGRLHGQREGDAPASSRADGLRRTLPPHLRGVTVAAALLAAICSTLRVYPHQLSYFNEAAGGPANGYRHLLGSNLDWGQNWLFVREWVDAHEEARPFRVRGLRKYDPLSIGIACVDDRQSGISPGWYAVDVNDLQRRGLLAPVTGENHPVSDGLATALRGRTPVTRLATSIYVFRVD